MGELVGDATICMEEVELRDGHLNERTPQGAGQISKWHIVVPSANPLLDDADIAFSLRDMVASGRIAHSNVKVVGQGVEERAELLISTDLLEVVASSVVFAKNNIECRVESSRFIFL